MQTRCDASYELYQPYAVRDWAAPFLISEESWKRALILYRVFGNLSFGNLPGFLWCEAIRIPAFFIFKKGAGEYGGIKWRIKRVPNLWELFRNTVPIQALPVLQKSLYKHIVSFYQGSTAQLGYFRKAKDNQKEVDVVIELPREKILCEVKYRNNSHIPATDAIVELCKDESAKVTSAFLITKQLDDFGIAKHETHVPILRVPAIAFLYLLGKAEADGQNGKM